MVVALLKKVLANKQIFIIMSKQNAAQQNNRRKRRGLKKRKFNQISEATLLQKEYKGHAQRKSSSDI